MGLVMGLEPRKTANEQKTPQRQEPDPKGIEGDQPASSGPRTGPDERATYLRARTRSRKNHPGTPVCAGFLSTNTGLNFLSKILL